MLRLMSSVEVLVVIDKEHTVHRDPTIWNDNAETDVIRQGFSSDGQRTYSTQGSYNIKW